jgi:hypothetical protein
MNLDDLFEIKQVIEILGIDDRFFHNWASTHALTPVSSSIGRPGVRRNYDFRNIVEAGVLRAFNNTGVAITLGARAVKALEDVDFKTVIWCWIFVSGDDVSIISDKDLDPDEIQANMDIIVNALQRYPNLKDADFKAYYETNLRLAIMASISRKTTMKPASPDGIYIVAVHDIILEVKKKIKRLYGKKKNMDPMN